MTLFVVFEPCDLKMTTVLLLCLVPTLHALERSAHQLGLREACVEGTSVVSGSGMFTPSRELSEVTIQKASEDSAPGWKAALALPPSGG